MRILHLSDLHLTGDGGPGADGVDTAAALGALLHDLKTVPGIGAVAVSGDVADDGTPQAYAAAREIIGGFAGDRGIPLFLTPGNHDDRRAFAEVLGSGHIAPDGRDLAERTAGPDECAAASTVDGYRIITLDTLVPGKGYGWMSRRQLDWLGSILASPAHPGSVLIFHHPPIALSDDVFQQALGLRNREQFADAIRGSDVRLALCGHYHLQLLGHLAGVPMWVTPGVASRIDLTAPRGGLRAVRGASATLVDLGVPGSPLFHTLHARDPRAGEPVCDMDEAELRQVVDEFGQESRDAAAGGKA